MPPCDGIRMLPYIQMELPILYGRQSTRNDRYLNGQRVLDTVDDGSDRILDDAGGIGGNIESVDHWTGDVEPGYYSFVSQFKIPYLYGLTVGELAVLLNEEGLVIGEKGDKEPFKCKLTVVPMEGWSRDLLYTQTDLPWVLPSPHMPQAETVLYYPASGILGELGYMSIGVGYTLPFQIFAAPWIVAEDLVAELKNMDIEGVEFRPLYVKPFYSAYKGENIGGVQMYVTDFDKVELTAIQFYIMEAMAKLYPEKAVFDNANEGRYRMFDLVSGSNYIRETFAKNNTYSSIKEYWNKDVAAFKELSKKYYMYK